MIGRPFASDIVISKPSVCAFITYEPPSAKFCGI
jgi:hypothetical protein